MARWEHVFWRAVFCYLVASITCLLYILWPNFDGHPHVPFSSFPDFLVWAPIAPYIAFKLLEGSTTEALVSIIVFGLVFVASHCALHRIAARK